MDQDQNMTPKDDAFPTAAAPEKSNLSMFVGVGAFIIVLVGLGWYVMQGGVMTGDMIQQPPPSPRAQTGSASTMGTSSEDAAVAALSTQGSSDDAAAINADLKATDLNSFDDVNKI